MDVDRVEDPAAFLEAAGPLLLADEARHNLLIGLAGTLRDHAGFYPDYGLWLVRDGNEVVGAALRTPPHNLVLAQPRDPKAVEALAEAIDEDLPGVVGALPEVESFAAAWAAQTGTTARKRIEQGIFELERVEPVTGVAGAMRNATPVDRPLLREWWRAFVVEALGNEPGDEVEHALDHRLGADGTGIVLWEDGDPVSLAGFGGGTPNGIRVGPVYTPREVRGNGYASALVAELSSRLLAEGRRFCFLYTDLANPTSNKIYERIGYVRVCESAEIAFNAQTQTRK